MSPFRRHRGILKSATVNLSARIAEGVLGLLLVILLAREFGISASTDAYMIALWLPMFFWGLGETILVYSLVPYFVAIREKEGPEAFRRTVGAVFFWFSLFLAGIASLVFLAAPLLAWILAPGFSEETRVLVSHLLRWLAPVIFIGGLGGFASCLFYAAQRFVVPAASSLLPDLGAIGFLLLYADSWGITAPAAGFMFGVLAQGLLLFAALAVFRMLPVFRRGAFREFWGAVRLIGPRFGGASINRFNMGVDRFFASMLGPGSVSALVYAFRLAQVPIVLSVAALGKTLMPVLTREVIHGGPERLRSLIPRAVGFVGFSLAPIVLFFVFFSEPLIRVLYQRGGFDPEATRLAAEVLLYYSLGILFTAFCILFQGVFYALQDTLTPLKVNAAALVINVVADVVLMNLLGLPGIALASVLVAACSAVFLYIALKRRVGGFEMGGVVRTYGRLLPVWGSLGGLAWGAATVVSPFMAPATLQVQILWVAALFMISGGVYLLLCRWFQVDEYRYVARMLGKGFK